MTYTTSYYRIYLLAVWQEPTSGALTNEAASEDSNDMASESGWRFALEDPRTGQRRGFANAVDLVAMLLTDIENEEPSADGSSAPAGG